MTLFKTTFKTFSCAAALLLATGAPAVSAELTVSAASSLSNAFTEVGLVYQAHYPGSKVVFNFGASGALLQQLARGAPADVFAAADQDTMDLAQQQGLVKAAERRDFARNELVLVVPKDRADIPRHLAELAAPGIGRIAIGNPASVPAGRYARAALQAAQLWPALETKTIGTQNVRQALDYVARGEVDAAFVYASDAALAKDKVRLAFSVALAAPVSYPAAPLAASPNGAEARRFVAFLLAPAAQAVLAKYGFRAP